MYKYCRKCGDIIYGYDDDTEEICEYCGNIEFPVPEKYIKEDEILTDEEFHERAAVIREEFIKNLPEFDSFLFEDREHKEEMYKESFDSFKAKMEHGRAVLEERSRRPKCPSCGSSNISKVGLISRAISFELVGFASSKIGKTHKCNNCGTMW